MKLVIQGGYTMYNKNQLRVANDWMKCLARGYDPRTGEFLSGDTVIHDVEVTRCFYFLSEIIEELLSNSVIMRKRIRIDDFYLTDDMKTTIQPVDCNVTVSTFIEAYNARIGELKMKKLQATKITNWLLKEDYLIAKTDERGKNYRIPSERGKEIGLSSEERSGQYGTYEIVLYSKEAQEFLIAHMEEITKGITKEVKME